jgi:hypothetical protein
MNATSNWNNHAATYHFQPCTSLTYNLTFGQAYLSTTFKSDFDAILRAIAAELQTAVPTRDEEDLMGISLTSWPL